MLVYIIHQFFINIFANQTLFCKNPQDQSQFWLLNLEKLAVWIIGRTGGRTKSILEKGVTTLQIVDSGSWPATNFFDLCMNSTMPHHHHIWKCHHVWPSRNPLYKRMCKVINSDHDKLVRCDQDPDQERAQNQDQDVGNDQHHARDVGRDQKPHQDEARDQDIRPDQNPDQDIRRDQNPDQDVGCTYNRI
jgi:hypothetical protein